MALSNFPLKISTYELRIFLKKF